MRQVKWFCAMVACALICAAAVRAEDAPPGGGRSRGGFDPAKMREQMTSRLKEQLAVSDDEWKAIQPKLDDLMKIQGESRASMRGLFGRPGGDKPAEDPNKSEMTKKMEALKALTDSKDADAKAIQEALKGLREEREKSKATLKKAQESLKELLSAKQEAVLVMYGMLE
ncbi:MAG: hypothetical protein WCT04_06995 [Planctomycetota bacterium]